MFDILDAFLVAFTNHLFFPFVMMAVVFWVAHMVYRLTPGIRKW